MESELQKKLTGMSVEEVAEIAAHMVTDVRDEAGAILDAALAVLEANMDSADFVRFCDKLAS